MDDPRAADALLAAARQALGVLASAPLCAREAQAATAELEAAWVATPLTLGIGGVDLVARTGLLDRLGGGGLLGARPRVAGSAALRLRRGEITRLHAVRIDGPPETQTLPATGVDLEARARVADAAAAAAARAREATTALALVPAALRTRPPRWALWRWLARWLAALTARRHVAAERQAAARAQDARQALASAEAALARREAPLRAARERFLDRLGELASGAGAGAGVAELTLDVGGEAVAADVELLELNGWSHAAATVDAVVIARDQLVLAPGGRGGAALPLGTPDEVGAALPALLRAARALRLARRVRDQGHLLRQELELVLERAAIDFAGRIARLEEKRVRDVPALVATQRAALAAQVSASVTAVLEHATAHLDSELALLCDGWRRAVAAATTVDELKAAVGRVDGGGPELARLADDVRVLVMGGLGGGTRDLYPELVAVLVPLGLPAAHTRPPRAAADVPPVELLPSLTHASSPRLADSEGWLTGLVRSLDHRRGELLQKVDAHVARLARVARAEMLDAEPRLHAALGDALAAQLETAVGHQLAWLEAALAAERATIDRERAALTPIVQQRNDARRELAALEHLLAEVEAAHPALAQAAAATPAIGSAAT